MNGATPMQFKITASIVGLSFLCDVMHFYALSVNIYNIFLTLFRYYTVLRCLPLTRVYIVIKRSGLCWNITIE